MELNPPRISRRTVLKRAAVGITGLGVFGSGQAHRTPAAEEQQVATSWSQYKGDAGHSGAKLDGVGPTGVISEAWQESFGYYNDGVAVVDGTAYIGGDDLVAVNAEDGTERWSFTPEIPPEVESEEDVAPHTRDPAVMDDTVYAVVGFGTADSTGGLDTALLAVDAKTGDKRWRVDTTGKTQWNTVPVTVAEETVVTTVPSADGPTQVTAFTADGTKRWQHSSDKIEGQTTMPISDGLVFVYGRYGVKALDLHSGETVWSELPRVRFDPAATPMVAGGTLFVAEEGDPGVTLIALDAETGAERWRTAWAANQGIEIGTADEDSVYIEVGGIDATVIALDRSNGEERWRATVEQPDESNGHVPLDGFALVGDLLYKGAAGLDPEDGSTVWKYPMETIGGAGFRLGAVVNGRAYLYGDAVTALTGTSEQFRPEDER